MGGLRQVEAGEPMLLLNSSKVFYHGLQLFPKVR
jgi:hypothetical protein